MQCNCELDDFIPASWVLKNKLTVGYCLTNKQRNLPTRFNSPRTFTGCDDTSFGLFPAGPVPLVATAAAACQHHPPPEDVCVRDFVCNCLSLIVLRLSSTMSMYQVKPICGGDIKIDLPTCMYKLPNIHAQQGNSCTSEHALQVTVNWFHFDKLHFCSPHKQITSLCFALAVARSSFCSSLFASRSAY